MGGWAGGVIIYYLLPLPNTGTQYYGCPLIATCCPYYLINYLLRTYHLGLTTHYSLPTIRDQLLTTYYLPPTTYYLLPPTYYLLTNYLLLLTTHHSPLTIHYLSTTTYY